MVLNMRYKILTKISSHDFPRIWQYIQVDVEIAFINVETDILIHLNVLPLSCLPILYIYIYIYKYL